MQKMDALVLAYLKEGNEVSDRVAVRKWEYSNVRNSISRLIRVHNYNLVSRWETSKTGARYKVWRLANINEPRPMACEYETLEYWEKFFGSTGDVFFDKARAKAMHGIYMETGKEYKEIWPEPGESVFKPIYEEYGYRFEAPKKASA